MILNKCRDTCQENTLDLEYNMSFNLVRTSHVRQQNNIRCLGSWCTGKQERTNVVVLSLIRLWSYTITNTHVFYFFHIAQFAKIYD